MIIENVPFRWLDEAGKKWLAENHDEIELHRPPPHSPELNPTEGVWTTTRTIATHNGFYPTVQDRDSALRQTFDLLQMTLAGRVRQQGLDCDALRSRAAVTMPAQIWSRALN